MKPYSETHIVERALHGMQVLRWYNEAVALVSKIPTSLGDHVRCHELARAVGTVLELPHQDGRFEAVEHTWLWACPGWEYKVGYGPFEQENPPPILDVYVPGAIPQVQLVDYGYWGLPYKRIYVPGERRTDINEDMVTALLAEMAK